MTITGFADGIQAISRDEHSISVYNEYLNRPSTVDKNGKILPHAVPVNEAIFEPKQLLDSDVVKKKESFFRRLHTKTSRQGFFIGNAGFANLDMIATINPPAAILFDINPNQRAFWERVFLIIENSETREECRDKLHHIPQLLDFDFRKDESVVHEPNFVFGDKIELTQTKLRNSRRIWNWTDYLDSLFEDNTSWLGSDKKYKVIHNLVKMKNIGAITLDLFDQAGWRALAQFIQEKCSTNSAYPKYASAMYLSNALSLIADHKNADWVNRHLAREKKDDVINNLAQISNEHTMVIESMNALDATALGQYGKDDKFSDVLHSGLLDTFIRPFAKFKDEYAGLQI